MSVDEAIQVLENEARTPRARSALSMLKNEIEATAKDGGKAPEKSSRKHPFPTKDTVAGMPGGKSSAEGKGTA